jgi:hypothetical protein
VADVERHAGLLSLLQNQADHRRNLAARRQSRDESSDPLFRCCLRGRMVLLRPGDIRVEGANCVLSRDESAEPDDDRGKYGGNTCHSESAEPGELVLRVWNDPEDRSAKSCKEIDAGSGGPGLLC